MKLQLKKCRQYRDQETKETKSLYFFTEHDMKNTNYLKVDATGKSILALLIQLGRLRVFEIIGVGHDYKRYAAW